MKILIIMGFVILLTVLQFSIYVLKLLSIHLLFSKSELSSC